MNTSLNESVRKTALRVKAGRNINGEDLRLRTEANGTTTTVPSDWGRAVYHLVKTGVITPTGTTTPAKSKKAHGRAVQVYTRNSTRQLANA